MPSLRGQTRLCLLICGKSRLESIDIGRFILWRSERARVLGELTFFQLVDERIASAVVRRIELLVLRYTSGRSEFLSRSRACPPLHWHILTTRT